MKKGKIIVMSPQHQNYFILLIDEVGGGGGMVGGDRWLYRRPSYNHLEEVLFS